MVLFLWNFGIIFSMFALVKFIGNSINLSDISCCQRILSKFRLYQIWCVTILYFYVWTVG